MWKFLKNAAAVFSRTGQATPEVKPDANNVVVCGSEFTEDDEEVPRYPPFMKGIPLKSPEAILSHHRDLISRIKDMAALSDEEFDTLYMEALRRFAAFVHLLPASQAHHHRGAGGMLRHGIEVALWAMQGAENVLVGGERIPKSRRELQPRWRFAVFISGLCHDIGKVVTDLNVIDRESDLAWNSTGVAPLYDWGRANSVHHYVITWNDGRNKQHESANSIVLAQIYTFTMSGWVSEIKSDLPVWIAQSVSYAPAQGNPIYDLVITADRVSVERDAKELGLNFRDAGYDLGVPVEKMLCDVMRTLFREELWRVNSVGARVWVIGDNVYIIWPAGGEDLVGRIGRDKIPGLPRSPESLAEFMLERKLIAKNESDSGSKYFRILPDLLREKLPNVRFPAIQLSSSRFIFDVQPESVEGIVVGINDSESAPMATAGATTDAPADAPVEGVQGEAAEKVSATPNRDKRRPQKTAPKVPEETSIALAVEEAMPELQPPPHPPSPPVLTDAGNQGSASTVKSKTVKPPKLQHIEPKTESELEKHPLLHQVLVAFKKDLDGGKKQWGVDALLLDDGDLCVRWPEGFQGYGIEPKLFLSDMAAAGWLYVDMATPFIRCFDTVMQPGSPTVKAARIVASVVKGLRIRIKSVGESVCAQESAAEGPHEDMNNKHDESISDTVALDVKNASVGTLADSSLSVKAEVLADTIVASSAASPVSERISRTPKNSARNTLEIDVLGIIKEAVAAKVEHTANDGCYVIDVNLLRRWLRVEKKLPRIAYSMFWLEMKPFSVTIDGVLFVKVPF